MRIGFIGLGVMGSRMAAHLGRAGHRLALHDQDAARTAAVAASLHGVAADSPAAAADGADVVITMLPDGQVVQRATFGPSGLAETLPAGAVLLDTSSAEPWLTRDTGARLAAGGATMVDAPVSGAAWGAEAAELVFMAGGAEADLERVRPLLDAMGRQVHHLGPLGCGHAMKCLNNCVTAMVFGATTEALLAGQAYGLDPGAMVDVLNASTGGSWMSETQFHKRIFSRAFDDPFRLALMLKDVGIATRLARETGTPMPFAGLGEQLYRMADRHAGDGASLSELVRWFESQAGAELRSAKAAAP